MRTRTTRRKNLYGGGAQIKRRKTSGMREKWCAELSGQTYRETKMLPLIPSNPHFLSRMDEWAMWAWLKLLVWIKADKAVVPPQRKSSDGLCRKNICAMQ
ncbi:hypothetical protein SUGI_0463710 [Cryptomeria japonica]|nr:hypothetical protein SUGI_0463710 [Cryptomeria japonica]